MNAARMNIWSCKKDITIKHLLLMLREEFSETAYQIIDPDITDKLSVRLGNPIDPTYSIYIYTYGLSKERYGVHIEYLNSEIKSTKEATEIFDDLSFEHLLNLLKLYFV